VDKDKILASAKTDLWGTYVDDGVSVAQGDNGVAVAGCEYCKKRTRTNA
jgi:hypothetical protein